MAMTTPSSASELDGIDIISVNGFLFCRQHGCELCHKCCYDFRLCNNIYLESEISKVFPEKAPEEIQDRPPITDVYAFGAVLSKGIQEHFEKTGDVQFECKQHHRADCSDCFDWEKLVIAKIKTAQKRENSAGVSIEMTREQKLAFLTAMGVEFSPSTRLTDKEITNKFFAALDISQSFNKVTGLAKNTNNVNPSSFPAWSKNAPKTVYASIRRGNAIEAMRNVASGGNGFPLYQNAFIDLRQTLMSLAKNWDDGIPLAILQDKEQDYAVCMRVVNVYALQDDSPLMVVLYERGTRATPIQTTLDWISEKQRVSSRIIQVTATSEEQLILLSVLNLNAKRLAPTYKVKRSKAEESFKLSFFLPMGPISQIDIGKLTHTTGCVLCGDKTTKLCTGCLSAEYCGPDCQKAHWKEHRPMCNTIRGGEWHTIKISTQPPASMGNMYLASFNHSSMESKYYDGSVPPNIHGNRPFMVKIQKPLGGPRGMMIYDRQRSFQAYMWQDEAGDNWRIALDAMSDRLKIYRWAKRVGDLELSICFNRGPPKDPQW